MVVTIKSSSTPHEIKQALEKLNKGAKKENKKAFDAHRFCGIIHLKEDPLAMQKKMRNEWQ